MGKLTGMLDLRQQSRVSNSMPFCLIRNAFISSAAEHETGKLQNELDEKL